MDRSLGTPAQPRIQDVTPQIRKTHKRYGGSDNTAAYGTSSGKCLNYAWGPGITTPEVSTITTLPFTYKFQDAVGLFGAENYFFTVNLKVPGDIILKDIDSNYIEAEQVETVFSASNLYSDSLQDISVASTDPNYVDAVSAPVSLPDGWNGYVSVRLNNLKTGNIYIDDWLDTRLYTTDRIEHPYELMYVRLRDVFTIGFHARNTKRLPYNVEVVIGEEFRTYEDIENKQLIMRRISY